MRHTGKTQACAHSNLYCRLDTDCCRPVRGTWLALCSQCFTARPGPSIAHPPLCRRLCLHCSNVLHHSFQRRPPRRALLPCVQPVHHIPSGTAVEPAAVGAAHTRWPQPGEQQQCAGCCSLCADRGYHTKQSVPRRSYMLDAGVLLRSPVRVLAGPRLPGNNCQVAAAPDRPRSDPFATHLQLLGCLKAIHQGHTQS